MENKNFSWFLGFLGVLTVLSLHFNGFSSNDFWIQAAVGDYILKNFSLPQTALYPFTIARDYPFLVHEWFASVVMSFIAGLSGENGLAFAIAKSVIAGLVFLPLYKMCRERSGHLQLSVLLASSVSILLSFRLTLRAENLAFIFFATFIYLFHQSINSIFQKHKNIFFILIILLITMWVNTHGSFIVAFAYMGLYLLTNLRDRQIWCLLVASLLMSLLNPYGYMIYQSSSHISTAAYMKTFISEWQPTFSSAFSQTPSFFFYVGYLVTSAIIVVTQFRNISNFDRLIYVAFAGLSLTALRHVVYFYLATAPILAVAFSTYKAGTLKKISYTLSLLLLANLVFVTTETNYLQIKIGSSFEAPLDLKTIQWIRQQNFKGSVFNSYTLGDQLVYNFYPDIKVVIDSRTDLYGADYMQRYQQTIFEDNEFFQFLKQNQIKLIVLSNGDFTFYFANKPGRLAQMEKLGWRIGFRSEYNFVLTLEAL